MHMHACICARAILILIAIIKKQLINVNVRVNVSVKRVRTYMHACMRMRARACWISRSIDIRNGTGIRYVYVCARCNGAMHMVQWYRYNGARLAGRAAGGQHSASIIYIHNMQYVYMIFSINAWFLSRFRAKTDKNHDCQNKNLIG